MIKVAQIPPFREEHIDVIKKVAESGQLVDGEFTKRFEDAWSSFVGKQHGIATCNGTMALYTALKSIGIGKGDEVIVPPLTFFATIEAVQWCGAKPLFVDIEYDTWCMDPKQVKIWCEDRPEVKAIIPVDIFGNPCDIEKIRENSDCPIIQDCAQAHGSYYKDNHVGKFANIACFSFMATKNLTNFGEGGMCVTDNPHMKYMMDCFIRHGMTDRNTHQMFGINGKMSEIHAALGYVEYQKLPNRILHRVNQHEFYKQHLRKVSWLKPQEAKHGISSRFWSAWLIDPSKLGQTAYELHNTLKEKGIETRFRYKEPLFAQPAVMEMELPNDFHNMNCNDICGNIIGLGLGDHISLDDQNYIIDTIKSL